jgi:hypothetical protein
LYSLTWNNIYNFKNTYLPVFLTLFSKKKTDEPFYNFADSARLNVRCCHIIL